MAQSTALQRINAWTLLFEPGSSLAYSNTGFGLLGRLLERKNPPQPPSPPTPHPTLPCTGLIEPCSTSKPRATLGAGCKQAPRAR